MDTVGNAATRQIDSPPGFPINWETPTDSHHTWARDPMHFSRQITPLEGDYYRILFDAGFRGATELVDMPIYLSSRRINTYFYQAMIPARTHESPEEASDAPSRSSLEATAMGLGPAWKTEYLPEIKRYLADWETFDLPTATLPKLLDHLDQSIFRLERLAAIHFIIGATAHLAVNSFREFYSELWGNDDIFAAPTLLQGLDNLTLTEDRALWKLGRTVAASSALQRDLAGESTEMVLAAFSASEEGRAFLAELRAYLERYGKRSETWFTISEIPWIDDPAPVFALLRTYAAQPSRDIDAELDKLGEARDAMLEVVRARLTNYPQAVRDQFEAMLRAAQAATILQEDHAYWIDFRSTYEMRRIFVEIGKRLTEAGTLDTADDIFYLTFDEIRRAASNPQPRLFAEQTAERRAEMARFATIQPPMMVGSEPAGPPPDNPLTRALGQFFGGPPPEPVEPGTLRGHAGSRGVVRGVAKIVRTLAETSKLQPGDILVAPTTSPPWTPLFATVAAVVTDTGGILSHCAVVAREFMIPAVVGTGRATTMIQDGDIIEVNGTEGVVRIIE